MSLKEPLVCNLLKNIPPQKKQAAICPENRDLPFLINHLPDVISVWSCSQKDTRAIYKPTGNNFCDNRHAHNLTGLDESVRGDGYNRKQAHGKHDLQTLDALHNAHDASHKQPVS